jgi:hypothetical protein
MMDYIEKYVLTADRMLLRRLPLKTQNGSQAGTDCFGKFCSRAVMAAKVRS